MKSNRLLFQLVPLTPRTEEIGSGLLPTPTATDTIHLRNPRQLEWRGNTATFISRNGIRGTMGLAEYIQWFPTPKAQDSRAAKTDGGKRNLGEGIHQEASDMGISGQLNLEFVEWMMGYPEGWTDLGD